MQIFGDFWRVATTFVLGLNLLSFHAAAQASPAVVPSNSGPGVLSMAIGIDALRWQDQPSLEAEFADLSALGVRWLRTDLNWALVQPTPRNAYDWRGFDRIVDLAKRYNLHLLPVLGSVPAWAIRPAETGEVPFDVDAFGRFSAAAVARYQGRGIDAWEIWNEPNMTGSWPGTPDAAAFATVLKAASAAIKSVDPEAYVISGGLAPAPDTGPEGAVTHVAAVFYLDGLYGAGAGNAVDAIGFHPYSWPLPPTKAVSWNGWQMMIGPIRAVMESHGDQAKPIWLTEYGAPTQGAGITEADQVDTLREGTTLARSYPWAGPLFFYSYKDQGTDPQNTEDWFGLLRKDGTQKPAYDVFRGLVGEQQTTVSD